MNINKEIAYLAKEKGYCIIHDECYCENVSGLVKAFITVGKDIETFVYISTQLELSEWIRVNYGYHIYSIPKFKFGQMMGYSIRVYALSKDKKRGEKIIDERLFVSFEDALMYGLKTILNKI